MRKALDHHTGVHLIAFTVSDASEATRQIAARGFDLQPTVHLKRKVEAADGTEAEAAFQRWFAPRSSYFRKRGRKY